MKSFYLLVLSVLFICFSVFSAETTGNNEAAKVKPKIKGSILGKRKPKTESDKAIVEIEKIVISFLRGGRDIADKTVQNSIFQQVNTMYPLNENVKVEKVNLTQIEKQADLEAKIKYPFTRKNLKEKYTAEAEKKIKPVPINSKLTVKYKQGPYLHTVTGIYYGLTFDHDGIRIGKTIVPLIDLLPAAKVKFDKRYREQKKEDYINKSIAKDLSLKENYAIKKITDTIKAIVKKSEDAGYILAWSKWRTPEDVAKIIINYYRR